MNEETNKTTEQNITGIDPSATPLQGTIKDPIPAGQRTTEAPEQSKETHILNPEQKVVLHETHSRDSMFLLLAHPNDYSVAAKDMNRDGKFTHLFYTNCEDRALIGKVLGTSFPTKSEQVAEQIEHSMEEYGFKHVDRFLKSYRELHETQQELDEALVSLGYSSITELCSDIEDVKEKADKWDSIEDDLGEASTYCSEVEDTVTNLKDAADNLRQLADTLCSEFDNLKAACDRIAE